MADKTIGDLNFAPGTVDDSNTLFVVQQTGTAYKLSGHEFILALTTILDGHGGVKSVTYTAPTPPSLDGTMVVTLADNSTTTVTIKNGRGITSVSKTGTSGLNDTYTISYNDGTTSTFVVKNGAKGDTGQAWYVWIRYAGQQPTQDSDMGTSPDDWMGIYSGTSTTPPTHYTSYTWFQIKGEKGDTGAAASIVSDAVEYQVSNSGTVVPTGTWSSTVPAVTQGMFLWTRTTVTFNSGSPVVWYAVAYQAVDGEGSPGSSTPLVDSGSGVVGTAVSYSREDHQHPLNVATSGTPVMDGTASRGSASTYARSDHVHPKDTSKANATDFKAFTVTLASASWNNGAQTVSNSNFVASGYAYVVSPASASFAAYGEAQIYADNVTTDGSMTFHCTDAPSSNLTVNIVRVVAS